MAEKNIAQEEAIDLAVNYRKIGIRAVLGALTIKPENALRGSPATRGNAKTASENHLDILSDEQRSRR
jgi:hypothetical protein